MDSIIISAENEIELQRILDALDTRAIPCLVKRYADSSFPSITQGKPFAEISIDVKYRTTVNEILSNLLNRVPEYKAQPGAKSRWSASFIFMMIYSLLISVVALRYWYIHKKSSIDKNFDFQWSYDGSWLHSVNKTTGKDANLYIDENLNYSFEEILTYSDSGLMVTKSIDRNENGRYEQFLNYNHSGDLVIKMDDIDDDGVIDEMHIAVQGKKALRLVDKNKDGIFEFDEVNSP
jgi:hypothetical protein